MATMMEHAVVECIKNTLQQRIWSVAPIRMKWKLTQHLAQAPFLTFAAGSAGLPEFKGCHDDKETKPSFFYHQKPFEIETEKTLFSMNTWV